MRTCDGCGTQVPKFVPRKTVNGKKICEACQMWHARTATLTRTAALANPSGELQGKHPEEWYHGTRHGFDHFGDPHSTHPLAYEDDPDDGTHWNTIVGNHFAAQHSIASRFAGTGPSASQDWDEGDDDNDEGNVIHAKLHIKHPKTYRSEHDMDQEVYEHEHRAGNHIDKHLDEARPDDDDEEADWYDEKEEFPRAHMYKGDSKRLRTVQDQDTGMYGQHREYWHPYATGWLNSHPDKHGIATRFRDRLKAQGHDGVVYGNDFEQDAYDKGDKNLPYGIHEVLDMPEVSRHNINVPQRNIAAIPLDAKQIEVTQRHGDGQCKTPDEVANPSHMHVDDRLPHHRTPYAQPRLPETDVTRTPGKPKYTPVHPSVRPGHEPISAYSALDDMIDLYHHTSANNAEKIVTDGFKSGRGSTYFTDNPDSGHLAKNWGAAKIHVRMPKSKAHFLTEVGNGEGYYVANNHEIFPEYIMGVTHHGQTKTAATAPEFAANHAGKQTVWQVATPSGLTPLCHYHRSVHESVSQGSADLARDLGIPLSPEAILEGSSRGRCADCSKSQDYPLKLARPEGYDRQQDKDSRQPRKGRTPYMPAKTKPLTPLKQSESAADDGHYCKACKTHHDDDYDVENHEGAYTDWDKHYPSVGDIHRGVGVHLPQDLHDRLHAEDEDLEDDGDDRSSVMHDLVGHLNKHPGGWHWTTSSDKAQEFAHDYGNYADQEHDTPRTYLNLTGHRPAREHIETDLEKLTDTDDQDYGGAVERYDSPSGEREVPLKAGTKVHLKDIGFQLHGPRSRDGQGGWRHHNLEDDDSVVGPRHVTASYFGVKTANEQLELFHVKPNPKPAPPKVHVPEPDDEDEYEPDECEHCGEDKKSEDHGEAHEDWLRDQKWHTDWDEDRPVGAHNNDEIQRGMAMSLPKHIHDIVHDTSRPAHERGEVLANHVIQSANDNGHIGRFWTDEDSVSRQYAEGSRVSLGSKDDHGTDKTPVVVHVGFPGYHKIEKDPEELEHHGVYSYHIDTNREVPLQHGTALEVKGVSWAPPRDNYIPHTSEPHEWQRYDFKEPIKAMSSKKTKLPTLRQVVAHDATENQAIRHCPFCGSGKIIGRADGSVECEFCHSMYTVQVQPQYPNFPQTIGGEPQSIPGMPGQVETPSMEGGGGMPLGEEDPMAEEEGVDEDEGNPFAETDGENGDEEEPPPFAKKSSALFRTASGARLAERDYADHLALSLTTGAVRSAMLADIRDSRGA